MQYTSYRKRTLWQRVLRRIGAWLLCMAGDEKGIILVPGTGVFIKNNKTLEVR